jgi:hypothetical protein
MSRKYVILDADEVDDIEFSEVLETSLETLRFNLAETQTSVKYEGPKPRFLFGHDTLTHSEMVGLVQTAAWQNEE